MTPNRALVSILIPVYNAEKYLAETIESCLKQTYKNIELILVDDGSTDNSLAIAKTYESEKVKVFTQPNSGACRARNLGFEKSSGDYIQYLDADDLLAPNKIEEQVHILENAGKDTIAFCGHTRCLKMFSNNQYFDESINKHYLKPVDLIIDIIYGKGNIITHCWLTPRDLIIETGIWDEALVKNQDGDFFTRVLSISAAVVFTEKTCVYYRPSENKQSISSQNNLKAIKSELISSRNNQNLILNLRSDKYAKDALAYNYSRIYCNHLNLTNISTLNVLKKRVEGLDRRLYFVGNGFFKSLSCFLGLTLTVLIKNYLKKIIN
jgi:glycosyltransferase involved in cell wall biosynthesis